MRIKQLFLFRHSCWCSLILIQVVLLEFHSDDSNNFDNSREDIIRYYCIKLELMMNKRCTFKLLFKKAGVLFGPFTLVECQIKILLRKRMRPLTFLSIGFVLCFDNLIV